MIDALQEEILMSFKSNKFIEWLERHKPESTEPHPWAERELLPIISSGLPVRTIEIMGLSEAGKSSGLSFLERNPISRFNMVLQPELTYKNRPTGISHVKDDFNKTFGTEFQIVSWNQMKVLASLEAFGEVIDFAKANAEWRRKGQPTVVVLERGPNDILATNHTAALMATGKEELPEWTRKNWSKLQLTWDTNKYLHPDFSNIFLTTYLLGLTQAKFISAVVLYDLPTYQITRERRVAKGDTPEGVFVNEKNFPLSVNGYDTWLNWIFPVLRKRYGTGLLVLDGTKPVDQNNTKLRSFCEEVCKMTD